MVIIVPNTLLTLLPINGRLPTDSHKNVEETGTLCYSVVVQMLILLETNNECHKGMYKVKVAQQDHYFWINGEQRRKFRKYESHNVV